MKDKFVRLSAAFIMTLVCLVGIATSDAQAKTYSGNRSTVQYRAAVSYQRPLVAYGSRMVFAPQLAMFSGIAPCFAGYGYGYACGYGYPYGYYGYGNQAYLWQQAENQQILQVQASICAERQRLQGDEISLRQTESCLSGLLASRGIPYDGCAVSAAIRSADSLSAHGCPGQGISLILQEQSQLNQEIAQLQNPQYMMGG